MGDRIRFWLVHLVPVVVCVILFDRFVLKKWAPHVFGRITGATDWRKS